MAKGEYKIMDNQVREINRKLTNEDIKTVFIRNNSIGYHFDFVSGHVAGAEIVDDNTLIVAIDNGDRIEFLFDDCGSSGSNTVWFRQTDVYNELMIVFYD